nr:cysteine-rich receptor-like protein kinase [Tanacetum cinerariifolium]
MVLSHMFFTDDAVFVGQWSNSNIYTIIYALKCFERASGLCMNMYKSKIMGIAVNGDKVDQVAHRIGYGILEVPFTYLGCNSSFIALIPKILDAKMVKDFRPISLIGSLYKIIAKILANRSVTVLGDVINEIQSTFVADRQILNGPFILNEVLRWCKLKKKQSFIFKIDFEKAYDSVRWDYLEDVLKKFGFGEKWCKWIRDPLSPFLFILIMESLHLTFQNVVDAGSKVGGCMSRIQNWNDVVENMSSRLSKWKMKTLSIGAYISEIYALEVDKNISVADKIAQITLAETFRREPRSGIEAVQLAKLEDQLEDVQLVNKRDRWAWSLNGSGEFYVASIRRLLDDIRLPEVSSQTRWIKAVPIKVNILAWKVRLNGLPSLWHLNTAV